MADQDDDRDISRLVQEHATRHRADAGLRAAVQARIAAEAAMVRAPASPPRPWQRWWPAGLAFASGVACTLLASLVLRIDAGADALDSELVADHVRSLMPGHLTDVASTDQHTVKPWFQGRLDFAPPVVDLAAEGFPLVGGRLEYVAGRTAAALVYRYAAHNINLFVWPAGHGAAPPGAARLQGYNLMRWHDDAMQYALVSDVDATELARFGQVWRQRTSGAGVTGGTPAQR